MNSSVGELVEDLLLWPDRLAEYRCIGHTSLGRRESLAKGFTKLQQQRHLGLHDDDVKNAVEKLLRRAKTLWQWYALLLEAHAIGISFFGGEPRVDQRSIGSWMRLIRRIDPDALLIHQLVAQGQETVVYQLSRWNVWVGSDDAELERLFRHHKLTDTHVHLGGCDTVADLWRSTLASPRWIERRLEKLPRYALSTLRDLSAREGAQREAEKHAIREASRARLELLDQLRNDTSFNERERRLEASARDDFSAFRLEERRLLAWAWAQAKEGDLEVSSRLDRYLFGKNTFFHCHQPGAEGNPGLSRFRKYLDQARELGNVTSRRIRRDELVQRAELAAEPRFLEQLELRIAPLDNLGAWIDFFKIWESALAESPRLRALAVAFVIHFIRPGKTDDGSGSVPFEKERRRVDRQSAILHLFRRKHPQLARYIAGIDVANLERDCPPAVFTPYLRLLRGETAILREELQGSPFCKCWQRLAARHEHHHPVELPRLGLTYHAGEDFYHPLQGMYFIDSAIVGGNMQAGDRIGHGLAAGWDLEAFETTRGARLAIPRGVLWDLLVWAHSRAVRGNLGDTHVLWLLESLIQQLSAETYQSLVPLPIAHRLILESRHRLVPAQKNPRAREDEELWQRELFEPDCRSRRNELVDFPSEPKLRPLFAAVQKDFLRELARRRIVIELNPSSNWILGSIGDLRRHPFFRFLEVAGEALNVSFNTDDPGLFATRLDAEYALMLDAMLANGIEKHECIAILERVARTAKESFFQIGETPRRVAYRTG